MKSEAVQSEARTPRGQHWRNREQRFLRLRNFISLFDKWAEMSICPRVIRHFMLTDCYVYSSKTSNRVENMIQSLLSELIMLIIKRSKFKRHNSNRKIRNKKFLPIFLPDKSADKNGERKNRQRLLHKNSLLRVFESINRSGAPIGWKFETWN